MFEPRLKDIFPPGFDSTSSRASTTGSHYTLKLEQLYYSLIERYDPNTHAESVVVKSAWYGKQTRSTEHEFIVIQVEDTAAEDLTNYLVLDRNISEPSQGPLSILSRSWTSSQAMPTIDAFRVAYDGNLKQLLQECQLGPHNYLEQLQFTPEEPLRLYELVTLACVISSRYPLHRAIDSNCYLFAGLVWECMHQMRPSATSYEIQAKKRGKSGWGRYIPSTSQIEGISESVQDQLAQVELEFENQRLRSERMSRSRRSDATSRDSCTDSSSWDNETAIYR